MREAKQSRQLIAREFHQKKKDHHSSLLSECTSPPPIPRSRLNDYNALSTSQKFFGTAWFSLLVLYARFLRYGPALITTTLLGIIIKNYVALNLSFDQELTFVDPQDPLLLLTVVGSAVDENALFNAAAMLFAPAYQQLPVYKLNHSPDEPYCGDLRKMATPETVYMKGEVLRGTRMNADPFAQCEDGSSNYTLFRPQNESGNFTLNGLSAENGDELALFIGAVIFWHLLTMMLTAFFWNPQNSDAQQKIN